MTTAPSDDGVTVFFVKLTGLIGKVPIARACRPVGDR
jgi:hypothetical protein